MNPRHNMRGAQNLVCASPTAGFVSILLLLSVAVHLVGLSHPRSVVFDEVHFGRYASNYCCSHERFFDPHPPHAKLLIAGVAYLAGYRGELKFDHIGQPYAASSPVPLRLAPALAGTLLPLIVFALLRQLGAGQAASFFGGLLVIFDNALTTQSRTITLDMIFLVATFGALSLCLGAQTLQSVKWRALLVFMSGCTAGLAVGAKFTGLAIIGLILLYLASKIWAEKGRPHLKARLGEAGFFLIGATTVYLAGWLLHFSLLTQPGPGDAWGNLSGNLVTDIIETHSKMLSAHANLPDSHPYGSPWWGWPLMTRPIFLWNASDSTARMYLIGNPVVWWGISLLFVVILVNLLLTRVSNLTVQPSVGRERRLFWLPIVGYFASYIPLAFVPRVLFIYHYYVPLLFSLILVVLWLDYAGWVRGDSFGSQRASYHIAVLVLVFAFGLLAPLTYGLEAGAEIADKLFAVFPGWQ